MAGHRDKTKGGPKIRCFTFKGKRVCRQVQKTRPPKDKTVAAEIKEFEFAKTAKFQSRGISGLQGETKPERRQVGTRVRTLTKETFKRLKKEGIARRIKRKRN